MTSEEVMNTETQAENTKPEGISAHKFCQELMNKYAFQVVEIKVCFNSYRKTNYGFAICPINIQVFDKRGICTQLKRSDLKNPIKEIYVRVWNIPIAYLHCITFTPDGKFFNWFLENFKDEEYQKIARNMKIRWYEQSPRPMQAPSFPLKIECFKDKEFDDDDEIEDDDEKIIKIPDFIP